MFSKITHYFTKGERILWLSSVALLFVSFFSSQYISVVVCFAAFWVKDLSRLYELAEDAKTTADVPVTYTHGFFLRNIFSLSSNIHKFRWNSPSLLCYNEGKEK